MQNTLAILPEELRNELKDPFGPIYTDVDEISAELTEPIITIGDMVTYHLMTHGIAPDVAVVDGRTERKEIDDHIREALGLHDQETVSNLPETLSTELVQELLDAIQSESQTMIVVDGEEDLVTLPAIVIAPLGSSIVYGQPGEGMVHVVVTHDTKRIARDLLTRMETHPRLWTYLNQ